MYFCGRWHLKKPSQLYSNWSCLVRLAGNLYLTQATLPQGHLSTGVWCQSATPSITLWPPVAFYCKMVEASVFVKSLCLQFSKKNNKKTPKSFQTVGQFRNRNLDCLYHKLKREVWTGRGASCPWWDIVKGDKDAQQQQLALDKCSMLEGQGEEVTFMLAGYQIVNQWEACEKSGDLVGVDGRGVTLLERWELSLAVG